MDLFIRLRRAQVWDKISKILMIVQDLAGGHNDPAKLQLWIRMEKIQFLLKNHLFIILTLS